jgi:hypothetical protein
MIWARSGKSWHIDGLGFVYKRDCRKVVWMEAGLVASSSFIPFKNAALTCEQKYLRSNS